MANLVVEHLSKQFPTRGEPLRVLVDVSFSLDARQTLAIVGPSGSGKSTLLHILGTLDRPTSGEVRLGDVAPFGLPDHELAAYRNHSIGFVFQEHHLLPQCTALENVVLPRLASGPASREAIDRARELLGQVGLSQRLEHRPAELSGGERQRVAIARALINEPRLLLADEPTGNLDRSNAHEIGRLLVDVQQRTETTLVVVTHSSDLAAIMERRCLLDAGRLVTIA